MHSLRGSQFRPTVLMEKVSWYLEKYGQASLREIREGVTGKAAGIDTALKVLIDEQYVSVTDGPRGAKQHHSIKVYREAEDPLC